MSDGIIEVPAAGIRQITGRCTLHGCALELVPYADDGLETLIDAWQCPGLPQDPDLLALQAEVRELSQEHPMAMEFWPPGAVRQREQHWSRESGLRKRCRESWVLDVPAPAQDLAWAAGYLDARGNLYFKTPATIRLIITDQDYEVLARFRSIAGAGTVTGVTGKNTNRLQVSASGDLWVVLTAMRPLLTRKKLIAAADRALKQLSGGPAPA